MAIRSPVYCRVGRIEGKVLGCRADDRGGGRVMVVRFGVCGLRQGAGGGRIVH